VGETDVTRLVRSVTEQNHNTAQVFVFGLGDDVNTTFLDLLAQQNRGAADYARSGAEMSTLLTGFYNKIAYPVLADLRLALRGAEAYDLYPRDLGTLYRGGQLVVTGRYRQAGDVHVGLTATVAGQVEARSFDWPVTLPARDETNGFIPRVWGTRKVGYLLDEIRLRGENPELRDSVIQLARRFGIVTPYTSYLITDEMPAARPVEFDESVRRGGPSPVTVSNAQLGRNAPSGGAAPAEEPAPRAEAAPARDAFRAFQSLGGGAAARPMRSVPGVMATPASPASMAPPPPPAAPAAAPVDATGEAGRRISMVLRDLREAERVNPSASGARFVAGRSFVLAQGVWQEDGLTVGTARVLRVRPMSRGYFALLRLRPALREALALGSVRMRLDGDRVIEVSDAAPDTAESAVEAFLR
jgi:Ca-activated chloride channel family protein